MQSFLRSAMLSGASGLFKGAQTDRWDGVYPPTR